MRWRHFPESKTHWLSCLVGWFLIWEDKSAPHFGFPFYTPSGGEKNRGLLEHNLFQPVISGEAQGQSHRSAPCSSQVPFTWGPLSSARMQSSVQQNGFQEHLSALGCTLLPLSRQQWLRESQVNWERNLYYMETGKSVFTSIKLTVQVSFQQHLVYSMCCPQSLTEIQET